MTQIDEKAQKKKLKMSNNLKRNTTRTTSRNMVNVEFNKQQWALSARFEQRFNVFLIRVYNSSHI